MDTMIALDVDGVLNCFSRNRTDIATARVGAWPIRWRPAMLDRLKAVLALPYVEAAWLTTWLSDPLLLDELEGTLGLNGLVQHRAAYPDTGLGGDRFSRYVSLRPNTGRWWKFAAAEMLLAEHSPARFAWIDDDLGRAKGIPGDPWRPGATHDRLLLRTDTISGLLPADLDWLEAWATTSTTRP